MLQRRSQHYKMNKGSSGFTRPTGTEATSSSSTAAAACAAAAAATTTKTDQVHRDDGKKIPKAPHCQRQMTTESFQPDKSQLGGRVRTNRTTRLDNGRSVSQQPLARMTPLAVAEIPHKSEEEEPIYCEIAGNSPLKPETAEAATRLLRRPRQQPRRSSLERQQQQQLRRPLAAGFSKLRIDNSSKTEMLQKQLQFAAESRRQQPPRPPTAAVAAVSATAAYKPIGLGRRALTQLDMDASHHFQYPPQSQPQPLLQPQPLAPRRLMMSNRTLYYTSDTESVQSHPMGGWNRHKNRQTDDGFSSEYGFMGDVEASSVATGSLANQSVTSSMTPSSAIRKGLLWQQRDKIFSRWKERFFILTNEYLQCFKRGTSRITEMGGFIFKLRLSEIEEVELLDKKGYLTISLTLPKENSKILLRKPEGIKDWFFSLKECVDRSKERRRAQMKSTKEFWSKKQFTDSSSMEQWLMARRRVEMKYAYSETESCLDGLRHPVRERRSNGISTATVKTTDYGFIDSPIAATAVPAALSPEAADCDSPTSSSDYLIKKFPRDTSSTFSHDSGVDSMNTNTSGSVLSNQRSPVFELHPKSTPVSSRSKIPTLSRQKPIRPCKAGGPGGHSRHVSLV